MPDPADEPGTDLTTAVREPLVVLQRLLKTLTDTTASPNAIRAMVEAAREGVRSELAFWHQKSGSRAAVVAGEGPMSPDQCGHFARSVLAKVPPDVEVFRWVNPDAPSAHRPTAAILARTDRSAGWVVAATFEEGRRFTRADEEVVRMALEMLVGIRAHAHQATKQLLHGLIQSLTQVLDAKDPYTAGHSERVARMSVIIGKEMGLSAAAQGDVYLAGLVHDLGKIGIRDEVLWKPGQLTPAEFAEIKQHPVLGERILLSIEPFRRLCPAVRNHHERYDGTGYPDGLAGEAIPLLGRVLAVADSLDAMMSPRRYRPARSPIEIDSILAQEQGKQFDPAVVAAFMAVRIQIYPPIYQKGIGESAYHAIVGIVDNLTETTIPLAPDAS